MLPADIRALVVDPIAGWLVHRPVTAAAHFAVLLTACDFAASCRDRMGDSSASNVVRLLLPATAGSIRGAWNARNSYSGAKRSACAGDCGMVATWGPLPCEPAVQTSSASMSTGAARA